MSFRENAKIIKTGCLGTGVYEIWFETSDIAKAAKPGQFISVYSTDGSRLLPRPISICAIVDNKLRIVYRTGNKRIFINERRREPLNSGTSRQWI